MARGIAGTSSSGVRQESSNVVSAHRRPRLAIVLKRKPARRGASIESHMPFLRGLTHGSTQRHDHSGARARNEDGGEESAGGRRAQGAEKLVEQISARSLMRRRRLGNPANGAPEAAATLMRTARSGGEVFGDTSQADGPSLSEAFPVFLAHNAATFQVLPNRTLSATRAPPVRASSDITRQFGSYRFALMDTLARGPCPQGRTLRKIVIRLAAENASPNGEAEAT